MDNWCDDERCVACVRCAHYRTDLAQLEQRVLESVRAPFKEFEPGFGRDCDCDCDCDDGYVYTWAEGADDHPDEPPCEDEALPFSDPDSVESPMNEEEYEETQWKNKFMYT